MTQQESDISSIREALMSHEFDHAQMNDALKAFDRILERTLPELPENEYIECIRQYKGFWTANFDEKWISIGRNTGEGPTPRQAVLNAISKIGG
jgi:hypothetical protein